jgi:hypothetical protein
MVVLAETVDIREHTDHRITESMIERIWMPMHGREPPKMPEHVEIEVRPPVRAAMPMWIRTESIARL